MRLKPALDISQIVYQRDSRVFSSNIDSLRVLHSTSVVSLRGRKWRSDYLAWVKRARGMISRNVRLCRS
jgi:hypothetical protein